MKSDNENEWNYNMKNIFLCTLGVGIVLIQSLSIARSYLSEFWEAGELHKKGQIFWSFLIQFLNCF